MSDASSTNAPPVQMPAEWQTLTLNQRKMLVALESELGQVTLAAARAELSRRLHYTWLKESEEYRAAARDLDGAINDRIMREFYRRGVEGIDEPVFYKGEQVSTKRLYDTPALIALAKARMPRKFRENFRGHIQLDVGLEHNIRIDALHDPETLERLISLSKDMRIDDGDAPKPDEA